MAGQSPATAAVKNASAAPTGSARLGPGSSAVGAAVVSELPSSVDAGAASSSLSSSPPSSA
jgi:hypothetical protein